MEQTLNSRNSILNRTMIVSKRNRRPGLPEVIEALNNENSHPDEGSSGEIRLPNLASLSTRNHYRRETMTFETSNQAGIMNSNTSFPEPLVLSKTKSLVMGQETNCLNTPDILFNASQTIFNAVEKNTELNDYQKFYEIKSQILELISARDKEWAAFVEKQEKENLTKTQIYDLKLSVANRISLKAEAFFKICVDCGIDFECILRKESNAIHRLKIKALNDSGHQPQTPESEVEITRLTKERDFMTDEIRSLEINYSNLFKLYEKIRENCIQLKASEENLKEDICEQTKKYNSLYSLYNELLNDAQDKLNNAEIEIKRTENENNDKSLGIRLALKRAQIQINSMEVALDSKIKENNELNKICNELLSKRDNSLMTSNIIESVTELS